METKAECRTYYVISGEGERGEWMEYGCTLPEILDVLTDERSNGDRWARAYDTDGYNVEDHNDRRDVSHMTPRYTTYDATGKVLRCRCTDCDVWYDRASVDEVNGGRWLCRHCRDDRVLG